jgi:hypothetical protein
MQFVSHPRLVSGYGVNSSGYPERIGKIGFPFSRLRAEPLRRTSTGMTKKTITAFMDRH